MAVVLCIYNSTKMKPRQHTFVFPSVTSPFILDPKLNALFNDGTVPPHPLLLVHVGLVTELNAIANLIVSNKKNRMCPVNQRLAGQSISTLQIRLDNWPERAVIHFTGSFPTKATANQIRDNSYMSFWRCLLIRW